MMIIQTMFSISEQDLYLIDIYSDICKTLKFIDVWDKSVDISTSSFAYFGFITANQSKHHYKTTATNIIYTYKNATKYKIPRFLLIEDTIPIDDCPTENMVVRFSKTSPTETANHIHSIIDNHCQCIYNFDTINFLSWYVGGQIASQLLKYI